MKQNSSLPEATQVLYQKGLTNELKPKLIYASIKPHLDREPNIFDVLARLLNGSIETCTALCLDRSKLLIANNSGRVRDIDKCLDLLSKFITHPFKENYNNLEQFALKTVIQNFTSNKIREQLTSLSDVEYSKFENSKKELEKNNNIEDLVKIAIDPYNITIKKIAIQILQPLIDVRAVTNFIINNLKDEILLIQTIKDYTNNRIFIKGANNRRSNC